MRLLAALFILQLLAGCVSSPDAVVAASDDDSPSDGGNRSTSSHEAEGASKEVTFRASGEWTLVVNGPVVSTLGFVGLPWPEIRVPPTFQDATVVVTLTSAQNVGGMAIEFKNSNGQISSFPLDGSETTLVFGPDDPALRGATYVVVAPTDGAAVVMSFDVDFAFHVGVEVAGP